MNNKKLLLRGTFILTSVGIITRIIGFVYRIFLCNIFGEEQVGLYQLIFPLYALCFSFSTAGIQLSIARNVAKYTASGKKSAAKGLVVAGILISVTLSFATFIILQTNASFFSETVLHDTRCTPLLIAISFALPFAGIHGCICGYYLGLKQTKVTAYSQLLEQGVRVGSVLLLWFIFVKSGHSPTISTAIIGVILGEIAAALYCVFYFRKGISFSNLCPYYKEICVLAAPLTVTRVSINILQSVEAISIPLQLQSYGLSASRSLQMYGVLTGVALPCILFPSAITNSISTMLLPTVTDIQVSGKSLQMKSLIQKISSACFFMGTFFLFVFIFLGKWIGICVFHSPLSGDFLQVLAWICPFLYLNTTLISILNGLGKANTAFFINSISLTIRILGIYLGIPALGINGYLYSLLISQILHSILSFFFLNSYFRTQK